MRTWKRIGDEWHGYGNGFKAYVYKAALSDEVMVHISDGPMPVSVTSHANLATGKRWAERHYLKRGSK